jgi:hypothetical protein
MKALKESVSWLRKHNANASDLDDPTALAVSNLAGKAIPKDAITPEARERIVEGVHDWLRNTDERTIMAFDLPATEAFANLAGVTLPRGTLDDVKNREILGEWMDWKQQYCILTPARKFSENISNGLGEISVTQIH